MSNSKLKGVGWKELIKSPEYYAQQTKDTLSPIISRLSAVANKRLKRLEALGISYGTTTKGETISGVKKFGAKGKTLGQLRSEYKRLQGFLESPVSTVTGRKEEFYQAKRRLWEKASKSEREIIGKKPTRKSAYKEYLDAKKRRLEEQEEAEYSGLDETEIFDKVSALFQKMRNRNWIARSGILQQMRDSSQIRDYLEEMVVKANIYNEDVVSMIERDLGIDDMYEEEEDLDFSTSNFF